MCIVYFDDLTTWKILNLNGRRTDAGITWGVKLPETKSMFYFDDFFFYGVFHVIDLGLSSEISRPTFTGAYYVACYSFLRSSHSGLLVLSAFKFTCPQKT